MKKLSLVLLLLCLSVAGYSQITAAGYGFTATNGTFSSISSSGTSTLLSSFYGDDVNSGTIGLPFNFDYCGVTYTSLTANTNGWISLSGSTLGGYPSWVNSDPANMAGSGVGFLMPFWDDLYSSSGVSGGYYDVQGTAPNRVFIFEFNNFGRSAAPSESGFIQVRLYETTNVIEYIYGTNDYSGPSATIGIANSFTDYQTLDAASSAPTSSSLSYSSSLLFPADGQVYRYTPPPPCSGSIVAGTAHANLVTACATDNVVLNLTGTTAATGLTYQWQYYDGGLGVWTDFAGAITNPVTVNIPTDATIRALVTCPFSGNVDSSASVDVAFTSVCFCTPNYASSPSIYVYGGALGTVHIDGYTGSTLDDPGPATVPASGYEDRTDHTVSFQQGNTYNGSLSYTATSYNVESQVWIDFNDDGTFDPSEAVTPVINSGSSYTSSDNFTINIPLTAAVGSHRMRVRYVDLNYYGGVSSAMDPCNAYDASFTYNYGVTRDYYVNIFAAPACAGIPEAGTATASTAYGCPSSTFILDATGYTVATGLNLQWRTSPDGSTWTDIPGATTTTYNMTPTGAAYYQFAVTCTVSGLTDTTNAVYVNYFGACTCVPNYYYTPYSGTYDGIAHVALTGEAGTSIDDYGITPVVSTGYEDRTGQPAVTLQQGTSYTGSLALLGFGYNSYESQFWIDYNDDGNFDVSEEASGIINWGTYSTSGNYTLNIPLTATLGTHRMRVRYTSLGWGSSLSADMDPCNSYDASNTYYNGMAWDYIVNITPAPACSGTPDAGTAAASTSYACPSASVVLSATGYTIATGLTYQWYSSATGATGSWTAIPGATDLTYTASPTGEIYYQLAVTCAASTAFDTTNAVHVGYFSTCTCVPSYYYSPATTSYDGLSNVSLTGYSGSTINDDGPATIPPSGYEDRTSITVDLQQGGAYNGTLSYTGYTWGEAFSQFWIDFNDDGIFDASEAVTGVINTSSGTYSDNYTMNIPVTATIGAHRMRVRNEYYYSTPAIDPCAMYDPISGYYYYYGTTRDYIANIISIPDCTGAPVMGTASASPTSGGETTMFTVSAPGAVLAGGITYQWQSSPDGSTWTNIPGATNNTYTFIGITAETFYQLVGNCSFSTTSANTVPVDVTYVPATPCTTDGPSWEYPYSWAVTEYAIDAVTFNGFSGSTLTDAGITTIIDPYTAYLDHTTLPAVTMEQTGVYASSATWINPYSWISHQALQVWIDFNNNGVFEVSEEVSPVSGFDVSTTPNPTNFNISIPATAALGLHKMRIRGIAEYDYTALAPAHLDPCAINFYGTAPNYQSGDAMDYMVNIVPHCSFTASATTGGSVCPNTTVSLVGATTAPTYSWSGPGGFTSTDMVTTAPGIASAQVYTFVATDGTCTYSLTTTQNLLPAAFPPVISPAPGSVCNGSVLTLTATVPGIPGTVIFADDFNSGIGSWTVDNTGMISTSSLGPWQAQPDGYSYVGTTFHSPDNTQFVITNADNGGSGSYTVTKLISPTFSMAGFTAASLSFQHYFHGYPFDVTAAVEISTDGGTTWNTLNDYATVSTGSATSFQTATFDLTSYVGSANCQLRFNYNSNYGFYWAVDNVSITGTPTVGAAPTWASTTDLYVDPAVTTPYAGTAQYSVYMHPTTYSTTTTTHYIASVALGTCISSDTTDIIVNVVSPIVAGGSTTICAGNTLSLTDVDAGGTWSLSNTTVANITAGGVVTGLASGVDTAYYNVGGCSSYIVINVSTVAPTISGTTALCTGGLTTTLTATGGAGTWSGGSASVATVGAGGVVTSAGVGSTIITYTLASGCSDTALFTVQAPPAAITGTASVCYAGGQTTLSDVTTGGTWSVSGGGAATITSGGVVTGLGSGPATVTYTTLPNCYATVALTLNAYPSPITGASTVCTGFTTTLSDLTASGTCSTSASGPATVNGSGNVTGISAGNATITYTSTNGCAVTKIVTVNSSPSAITGTAAVCYTGGQTTLTSSPAGGTWSSSNGTIATVTSGGVVTGLAGGSATITYTSPLNSCYATRTLTLNANPNPIAGVGTVCAGGGTLTLTESSGSGTWTSGATGIATVTSGGMVTGVSAGNAAITFTDANNCRAVATVTVNALPAAITGTTTICNLASTTLADASTPGTWSTTTPAILTVNASGVVTGVSSGVGTVVFTQTSTGCSRSASVTVNGLPTSITAGATAICAGTTTTVTGTPTPGTWSATPSTVATVTAGGVVGGVGAGTATITYTNLSGCYITTTLTVNPSFVPTVAINATPGLVLCDGTAASYSATITNGGTAPTYAWTVNSLPVSTASTYNYMPANGDIVGLTITSNLACAIPTTATAAVIMTVNPIIYPSLSINGTHNDTSCEGSPVTINTFPSASSTSPTYQWYVNGTPTATGSSYSYVATNGDVVVAVMTAGASCLSGSSTYTAADTMIMDVLPVVPAGVTLSSSTGAVSCFGNIVSYLASATNGGSVPTFLWSVNGTNVATGPGYFYTPANGDVVVVTMTSNYLCVAPATDTAMMTMSVITGTSPVIVITTTHAGMAYSGMTDTFNVNIVSGGGTTPTYQWFVNGVAVTGETGPSYITNMLSVGDVVTCHVTNGDPCGGVTISNAITTVFGTSGVNQVGQATGTIEMMPNPNNGSFTVKGNLGVAMNEDMLLEVTDMVGQVVYSGHTQAKNGAFSEKVQLSGVLANGMYILNVRAQHMQKQFHFVLNQQ